MIDCKPHQWTSWVRQSRTDGALEIEACDNCMAVRVTQEWPYDPPRWKKVGKHEYAQYHKRTRIVSSPF